MPLADTLPASFHHAQGLDMKNKILLATLYVLTVAFLTGCSSSPFAPEYSVTNAFLKKVQTNCGTRSLGGQSIDSMFGMNSNETMFLDLTSDLVTERISRSDYAATLNGFFPTGGNDAAIDCVFDQLGNKAGE
jgi:hypothetical protein